MKQMTTLFNAVKSQPCHNFLPINTVETIVSTQEK